jgi:hypothetical protein
VKKITPCVSNHHCAGGRRLLFTAENAEDAEEATAVICHPEEQRDEGSRPFDALRFLACGSE